MNVEKYLGKPEQIQRIKRVFYVVLGILVLVDFFIRREHVAFVWDVIPGFNAFYGLVSAILLIIVTKFVGHTWLMKREDYYD
ncbi:MAG: hypothetical protein AABZ11_11720 [Nitrospinota bacterium]|jgi:hypothetical protein